jgi:hypothetical protein
MEHTTKLPRFRWQNLYKVIKEHSNITPEWLMELDFSNLSKNDLGSNEKIDTWLRVPSFTG